VNFTFTEEQRKFREEIRDFCQRESFGEIDARIRYNFSPELYRKMAAKGWIGLAFPKEYGGQGLGKMEETILFEEMSYHRAPMAHVEFGSTVTLAGGILLKHGSEQQKRYYLPRVARGQMLIGQGFTEPNAGSDLLSLTTSAVREGDHYIINGEKMFMSWAHEGEYLRQHNMSNHVLLLARTDQSAPSDKSLSLLIFDVTTPLLGMSVRPIMTLYDRTNEVSFDNVRIPAESLVGEENQAWDYVVESGPFYWERFPGWYLALMTRQLQELVEYVKETQVDGQPLSKNALSRRNLAELAIRIEGLRLYTYRLAWAIDKGLDFIGPGSIMKFHTGRLLVYFSNAAMQILGPYGQLEKESKYVPLKGTIEAWYKGLIMYSFMSTGASAMVNVIADYVLGLPNEFGLIY